jgi:DNA-binding MarR family transcriptional regulator
MAAAMRKPIEMQHAKGREDVMIPPQGLCSGTSLRKAARRVSLLYDTVIAPTGLRSTQMAVLIHVARHQDPTMGELANYLVIDRSALSENLKPLIRQGLIEVKMCEQDKRGRRVRLTDTGYDKLSASMPLWRSAQQRFDEAFGSDAAQALRDGLARIAADEFLVAFDKTAAANG